MSVRTAFCAKSVLQIIASHTLKMALIKATPTGSYGLNTLNYSEVTDNSDETSGLGYTAGGVTLAGLSVGASTDGTVAWLTFTNPAWAAATFQTSGAIIYDTSAGNRAIATISFGEVLSPNVGTLTIQLPAADAVTALIKLASPDIAPSPF